MKQRIVVQVLIKHRDKYLFLGKKHFDKNEEGYLDLIGGTVAGGESLISALKREAKEKIHLELNERDIRAVDFDCEVMNYKGKMTHVVFLRYFAEVDSANPHVSDQNDSIYWLRESELSEHNFGRSTERFLKKLALTA